MEKCTRNNKFHVCQLAYVSLFMIVLGALVDAPICIAMLLLTQEGVPQKKALPVRVPAPETKPVEAPAAVVTAAPASGECALVEVPVQDAAPVAVTAATPVAFKAPSNQELLEQADRAVAAAKKAATQAEFAAQLKEAQKLARRVGALTKDNKNSEEYKRAKAIFFGAKRLKKQREEGKRPAGQPGEPEVLKELDPQAPPPGGDPSASVPMTYKGRVKAGAQFCTQQGLHPFIEGGLAVQAKLADCLIFDGEGIAGLDPLNLIEGEVDNPYFEIRKFSLTYESPTIAGLWVKAGKFESPLSKNPVGGNLLCLHPVGLFAGYGGSGTEGLLDHRLEQLNFVGGFSQDPKLGTVLVGEISAHTRESEIMGRICTLDLALANVCSLSYGSWLVNPKAALHFSLWEEPVVASAEMLLALGGSEVQSALRLGFRVGDVDEFGQPKEVGGWMFQFVTTWTLPDACHTVSVSYSVTVGTRPLDWLTVIASAALVMEDEGAQNRLAITASAQLTEKLRAALTAEVAQETHGPGSATFQSGLRAEVEYDITDRLGLTRDGFFKTARVEANAFLGQASTGLGVALDLGF